MRLLGFLTLGAGLVAAVVIGYARFNRPALSAALSFGSPPAGAPTDSSSEGPVNKHLIFARGTLEPRHGVILVGTPLTGLRVKKVFVQDGDPIGASEPLIELDTTSIEAELKLAQAQLSDAEDRKRAASEAAQQRLKVAQLAVEQAQKSRQKELVVADKQVEAAKSKLKAAQTELDHLNKAPRPPPGAPSNESLIDRQKGMIELATIEREAAEATRDRAAQALDFALEKAQAEQQAAAQAKASAERSQAAEPFDRQVKIAQQKLEQARIVAPSAGTIISVLVHEGDLVGNQPLVQVADLSSRDSLVCLAEVDVADVFAVREGKGATITCRALPTAKIRGYVERVKNRAGPATLRPVDPRQPVDRTVATVVLRVDEQEVNRQLGASAAGAAGALVGLQVNVEIPK